MLTFGLLVSGVGTLTMLRSWVLDQTDNKLLTIAQSDLSSYFADETVSRSDLRADPSEDVFIALFDPNGSFYAHNWSMHSAEELPRVAAQLTVDDVATLNQDGRFEIFPLRAANGDENFRAVALLVEVNDSGQTQPAIIALSMADTENLLRAYVAIFLGLGIAVVILGALLTRMLVTTTFAPLRQVEQTAAAIADGDFSQRMEADTPNTEVGRLNQSLNSMLNRIDRALGDRARTIAQMRRFVGDASHELRTPLVSVRGYAELYRMGALQSEDEVAKAMERIEKEAIRMSELVEDLLELARIDEAKPLRAEVIDLVPLARDAALDAHAIAPDRSVTVVAPLAAQAEGLRAELLAAHTAPVATADPDSVNPPTGSLTGPIALAGSAWARLRPKKKSAANEQVAPRAPSGEPAPQLVDVRTEGAAAHPFAEGLAVVMGEENKIRQVMANLVGNALRYTPEGTPIELRISMRPESEQVELDVVDHGDGIPAQIRDKIFERFWRADTSRARETGGSGLGLAIVASIVKSHNGTVNVIDTPGGGATFRVVLPLASSPLAPRPESAHAAPSSA